jgi:peptidylprolyl isomerase
MSMAKAKNSDTVKVHYTGRVEDGKVFDSSENRDPLLFTIGEGKLIPGFEQAVIGMNPGDTTTIQIPAEQAYGSHREDMIMEVDRNQIPENLKIEVGQQLQLGRPEDQKTIVTITGISESKVTLDANHPLAGMALTFDIRLIEIL